MAWLNGLDLMCFFFSCFASTPRSPTTKTLCSCDHTVYVRSSLTHLPPPPAVFILHFSVSTFSKSSVLVSIRPECEQTMNCFCFPPLWIIRDLATHFSQFTLLISAMTGSIIQSFSVSVALYLQSDAKSTHRPKAFTLSLVLCAFKPGAS